MEVWMESGRSLPDYEGMFFCCRPTGRFISSGHTVSSIDEYLQEDGTWDGMAHWFSSEDEIRELLPGKDFRTKVS